MKKLSFAEAVESCLMQKMAEDHSVFIMGEDVQMMRLNILARFGKNRVINTPISEAAFTGAAIAAAMSGLRPVVEVMLVDFIGVAADSFLNNASKLFDFSGGKWNAPVVYRCACGGGYGDGGQHEQSLWGWLAHIPGISVVVPSNPIDAGGLLYAAIEHDHPVFFLEHKLLAQNWLEYMGIGGRSTVQFDVPEDGAWGEVPKKWTPIPLGKLNVVREGKDITLISVGVGVHRCVEAASKLEEVSISAEILDLRSISPLDIENILQSVRKTGAVIIVDEDYKEFGLSGEIAAILAENQIEFKYGRVCTEKTIPFNRESEDETLPNVARIMHMVKKVVS